MFLLAIFWFFVRPFVRKANNTRKRLAAEQRIARHTAVDARDRAAGKPRYRRAVPDGRWSDAERAYFAQHAVSPYDQD